MTALLQTEDLGIRFGGLNVLEGIDLEIRAGEATGLIGPNGAGKTTLINIMSGVLRPTRGTVRWRGDVPSRWSLTRAAHAGVARTFQASRVFDELTVRENVDIAELNSRRPQPTDSVLELVGLRHRADDLAGELPYGEGRRLGVALALATGPELLLLDEPAVGMTGQDVTELSSMIGRLRDADVTVVVVDHNMQFIMGTSERILVLEGGRIIADGTPDEVQADERVIAAYLGGGHHVAG